jgi:ABC-2 type transport system permease protein
LRQLYYIALIESKFFLRSKQGAFATFILPFFFLFLFGTIWGGTPNYFGYIVPGLIAMVTLSITLWGIGFSLTYYRQTGYLRRIAVSPLKKWIYIFGLSLSRFLINIIQSFALIFTAILIYKLEIRGSYLLFFLCLSLGIFTFLSIGGVIANLSKSAESVNAILSLVVVPLLFLSDAFVPIRLFPKFLQYLSKVSPVTYMIKMLRDIILYGYGIRENIGYILLLVFLTIICFFISSRSFKWN